MGRLDARVALITAAARGQGAAETTSRFGRPDVLVNNAASSGSSIAYTASKFAVLELAPFGELGIALVVLMDWRFAECYTVAAICSGSRARR